MLKAKHVSESRSCDRYHFKPLAPGDLWVDPGLSTPVRPSSHPTSLGLDDFFWEPRSLGWNMSMVSGEDIRKNAKKKMFFGLWTCDPRRLLRYHTQPHIWLICAFRMIGVDSGRWDDWGMVIHPMRILIYWVYKNGGYPKLWYPKTALTPRFREPFAPFRAPAESGHGIMIRCSCANSSQRFTGGLYSKTLLIGDPFSKLL